MCAWRLISAVSLSPGPGPPCPDRSEPAPLLVPVSDPCAPAPPPPPPGVGVDAPVVADDVTLVSELSPLLSPSTKTERVTTLQVPADGKFDC